MCQFFIYCKHVRRYIRPFYFRPCFISAPVLFLPLLFLPPIYFLPPFYFLPLFYFCPYFIFAPILFSPLFYFRPCVIFAPILFLPLSMQATFSTWVCSNIYFPDVSWIFFCHSDLMVGEINSLNLPEISASGEKGIEGNT